MLIRYFLPLSASMLLAFVLTGCGTSPPARFYHLEPMELNAGRETAQTKLLGVGPLHFPKYLDRPQIVTRTDSAQMSIDDYSRWAEPLNEATPRIVAANLSGLTDSVSAIGHGHYNFLAFDYRLVGNVLQFDADSQGRVQLVVQWWLQDTDGNSVIPRTTGRYQGEAEDPGRVSSVVEAMNGVLLAFSEDIAAVLEEQL